MQLDLRKIIDNPGASADFQCEIGTDRLDFPSVSGYIRNPEAHGRVFNEAGILRLTGSVTAEMICVCDRCGEEFKSVKMTALDVVLSAEESDENPELFLIEGDSVDLDEVVATCLILDMETKFLCKEDCKGLCPTCGKNLNFGACACRKQPDPRFAVLEQLLDK